MKKIIRTICILTLLASMLLSGFGAMTAQANTPREAFIGTWRWDSPGSNYVYVFREDGTGLRGFAGMRTEINWSVQGDELRINQERWRFTIRDDVLAIESLQVANMRYRYIFYSASTDLYTADNLLRNMVRTGLYVIGGMVALGVTALVIVLSIRSKRKRERAANPAYYPQMAQGTPMYAQTPQGASAYTPPVQPTPTYTQAAQEAPAYTQQRTQGEALRHITGKPSFVADLIILIVNVIADISFLVTGRFIWFFALLIFTILPAARLIKTLRSGIVVSDTGVAGNIKKDRFQLGYHEISSVSMADVDNNKTLLLVAGYHSYSITIKNARAVRDAIAYNMAVLGVTPPPVRTPADPAPSEAPIPTPPPIADAPHPTPISAADPPPLAQVLYTDQRPAPVVTESLRQQIAEICRRETAGLLEKFYVLQEIPFEKLENAMNRYAPTLGGDETAIFLYDNTVGGSGKSGFLLTSKYLYTKSDLEKATKSDIRTISDVVDVKKNDITVEMDTGNYVSITLTTDDKKKAALITVLDETISLLNSQEPPRAE
ncbi:MAG: TMEM199/VMA12 family vacuolar ATPase assembly factor [Oscillospiraceae bacterium]|nr:TMEM199/VMA12 family vacuolar ATPase assembly factor [Oscillospiraceae bacterium]